MIPPTCTTQKRRKPSHEESRKSPGVRSARDRTKSGSYADQGSLEKPTVSSSSVKRTRKNTEPLPPFPTSIEDTQNRLEALDEENSLASSIFVDEQIIPGCNAHKNCIHESCMMELKAKNVEEEAKKGEISETKEPSDAQLFNQDDEAVNPALNMNDDGSTEGEEDCDCGTKSVYNDIALERPNSLRILNRDDTIIVDQEAQEDVKKEEPLLTPEPKFISVKSESDIKTMMSDGAKMTPSTSETFLNKKSRFLRSSTKLDFTEESSKSTSFTPSPAVETEAPSFSDYFSDPNISKASPTHQESKLCVKEPEPEPTSDGKTHVYPLRSRLKMEKLRKQLVARQSKPKTFNQLPYEILTRILHYLNIQDVFRMQRVSRRMKEIVESYLGMIKRINFTNGLPFAFLPPGLDDKTLKKILTKTPRITHILGFYPLSIFGSGHDTSGKQNQTGLTYAGIIDAFRCCSKMRSVEIMNVELMSHLVQYLPYVKFHGMFRNRPDLWDSEYAVNLPTEASARPAPEPLHRRSSLPTKSSPILTVGNLSKNQPSIGYYVGDLSNNRSRSSLAQFAANYAHNAAIGASRQANLFEPQCELTLGEGCPSATVSSTNLSSLIVNGIPDAENMFAAAVAARPVIPMENQNQNLFQDQQQNQENFLQPLIVAPAIDAAEWVNLNNLNEIVLQQNNNENNNQQMNWALAALNQRQNQQNNLLQAYQIQRLGPPQNQQQNFNPRNFLNNPNGQAAAAAAAVAAMLVMRQNPDNLQPIFPNNNNPRGIMQQNNIENREDSNRASSSQDPKVGKFSVVSPLPSDQLIIPLPSVITSLTKLDLVSISINSLPRLDNIKYLHLKWVVFTSSDPFFHFSAPKLQSFVFNNCVGPTRFVRFVRIFAALSRATQLSRLELVGSRFVEGLIEHILDNYLSPSRNFRHLQRLILAGNKDVSEMDMGLLLIASQHSLVHVALQSGQSKNSLFEALTFSGIKLNKLESLVLGYQDPYQSRLTLSELNNLQLTESQDASMPICSITDRGIRMIHNVCPKLLSLHLRHCPYLSDLTNWEPRGEETDDQQNLPDDLNMDVDNQEEVGANNRPSEVPNSPLKSLILENCPTLSIRSLEKALFEGRPYPSLDTLVLRDMFPAQPPSLGIYNSLFATSPSWSETWCTTSPNSSVDSSFLSEADEETPEVNDYRILWLLIVIADSLSMSRIGHPSLSPSGVGLGSSARDVSHFNSINSIRSNDSYISSFEIFLSLRLHTYSSVLLQMIGGIHQSTTTRHMLIRDIFLGRRPLLSLKRLPQSPPRRSKPRKTASVGTQTCPCALLEVDALLRLTHPDMSKAFPADNSELRGLHRPEPVPFDSGLAFHPFIASNQYNHLGDLYKDQKWLDYFNARVLSVYSNEKIDSSSPATPRTTRAKAANPRKRRATESIALKAKSSRVEEIVQTDNASSQGICTRSKRKSFASSRDMQIIDEGENEVLPSLCKVRNYIQPLSSHYTCHLCSGQLVTDCDNLPQTPFKRPEEPQAQAPLDPSPQSPRTWKARDACVDTHELRCSPQSNCNTSVFTVCQSTLSKSTHRIVQSNLSIPQVIPTGPSNVLTTLHLEKVGLSHIVLAWLPRLKNLTVDCCPRLKGILLAPRDSDTTTIKSYVPSLRRVRIIRCPKFAIYNWLYTAAKLYPEHEENLFITYRPFGDYNTKVEQTLWQHATSAHVMVSNDFRHDQSERFMEEFHSNFDQLFREVMNFSEMLIRKNLIKVQHPEDSKYLTRTEHGVGWDLITDLPWIHEVCCSYLPCQHFCKTAESKRPPAGQNPPSYRSTPTSSSSSGMPTSPRSSANLSSIRFDQADQLYEILAEVKYQDWNRDTQINLNQRNLGSFKIAKKGIHLHVQHRDVITSQEKADSIVDWVHMPSSFSDYPYTDEYLKRVHPVDDYNVYSTPEAIHLLPPKPRIPPQPDSDDELPPRDPADRQNLDSWQRLLLEQDEIKIQ